MMSANGLLMADTVSSFTTCIYILSWLAGDCLIVYLTDCLFNWQVAGLSHMLMSVTLHQWHLAEATMNSYCLRSHNALVFLLWWSSEAGGLYTHVHLHISVYLYAVFAACGCGAWKQDLLTQVLCCSFSSSLWHSAVLLYINLHVLLLFAFVKIKSYWQTGLMLHHMFSNDAAPWWWSASK